MPTPVELLRLKPFTSFALISLAMVMPVGIYFHIEALTAGSASFGALSACFAGFDWIGRDGSLSEAIQGRCVRWRNPRKVLVTAKGNYVHIMRVERSPRGRFNKPTTSVATFYAGNEDDAAHEHASKSRDWESERSVVGATSEAAALAKVLAK